MRGYLWGSKCRTCSETWLSTSFAISTYFITDSLTKWSNSSTDSGTGSAGTTGVGGAGAFAEIDATGA